MKSSLSTRLTLSLLLAIVVTALLVMALSNIIIRNRFVVLVAYSGQRAAQRLAPVFSRYYALTGSWEGVGQLVALYKSEAENMPAIMMQPALRDRTEDERRTIVPADERLLLLDTEGNVLADSEPSADKLALVPKTIARSGVRVMVDGEHVGTLIVMSGLGQLNAYQTAFLRQVMLFLLIATLIVALVGVWLGKWQAQRILAPIKALSRATQQIAQGDLSHRIPVSGDDELGELAVAFNTMAGDLEHQQELRRRAMNDIAHELRTPLSVLQIEMESLEDGITEPTPEVISGLQVELGRLNHLVEDLRVLALTDAGELHLEWATLDLGGLVYSMLDRVRSSAREKGVTLSAKIPETPVFIEGDARRLSQVLLNLLSNAIQHTPARGNIAVTLAQPATETGQPVAQVTVQDTGEGIPAEHLPHIFERFYRPAVARSPRGTGLGLSIAKSLVEAHGGHISVVSVEGMGSTFTFTLPAKRSHATGSGVS
ncbi:MAG: HAMP domain-containing protein [Anaerolineae bacterium]|nr:HAMP domain-containing protein [Anaerolineae bacterium]